MKKAIQEYKNPSKLIIKEENPPEANQVQLSNLIRGDLCVRAGALCMIVEATELSPRLPDSELPTTIINLGTGRVWAASGLEIVDKVKSATLTFVRQE